MMERLLESNNALAAKAAKTHSEEANDETFRNELGQKQKAIDRLMEEEKEIKKAAEADLKQKNAALTAAMQQKEAMIERLLESNNALATKAAKTHSEEANDE